MSTPSSHTAAPPRETLAESVRACYQCGKCSAGCPVAERMDLLPHQLIRLVQIGRLDRALRSEAVWQCVSCLTCSTRCPQSVDCAGLIDALRELSLAQGMVSPAQQRTALFQQAFLENIRRNGRLAEMELIAAYKTRSFLRELSVPELFKDAWLAPKLACRGKLHLRGEKVKDRRLVARIFQRCQAPAPCETRSG